MAYSIGRAFQLGEYLGLAQGCGPHKENGVTVQSSSTVRFAPDKLVKKGLRFVPCVDFVLEQLGCIDKEFGS